MLRDNFGRKSSVPFSSQNSSGFFFTLFLKISKRVFLFTENAPYSSTKKSGVPFLSRNSSEGKRTQMIKNWVSKYNFAELCDWEMICFNWRRCKETSGRSRSFVTNQTPLGPNLGKGSETRVAESHHNYDYDDHIDNDNISLSSC